MHDQFSNGAALHFPLQRDGLLADWRQGHVNVLRTYIPERLKGSEENQRYITTEDVGTLAHITLYFGKHLVGYITDVDEDKKELYLNTERPTTCGKRPKTLQRVKNQLNGSWKISFEDVLNYCLPLSYGEREIVGIGSESTAEDLRELYRAGKVKLTRRYTLPFHFGQLSTLQRGIPNVKDIGNPIHIHEQGAQFAAGYLFDVQRWNWLEVVVKEPRREKGRRPGFRECWGREGRGRTRIDLDRIISYELPVAMYP